MPSASTTDPLAPAVELVDCDEAPDSVAIVCEAYELIQIHYVDQIEDSLLAEAAAWGKPGERSSAGWRFG